MSKELLSRIITYEQNVFNEYIAKRNLFIENLKKINNLDSSQTIVLVNDVKAIIDPIKTSISEIDFYFTNTDFKNNKNVEEYNLLIYLLLLRMCSSELDERSELSLSELSLSVSERSLSENSSRSVSETFSSK